MTTDYVYEDSFIFGHRVRWDKEKEEWYYAETGAPNTSEIFNELSCPKCGLKPTSDGHDPCIANLPGVKFACCGHGVEKCYIWFEDGTYILTGEIKASFMEPSWSDNEI